MQSTFFKANIQSSQEKDLFFETYRASWEQRYKYLINEVLKGDVPLVFSSLELIAEESIEILSKWFEVNSTLEEKRTPQEYLLRGLLACKESGQEIGFNFYKKAADKDNISALIKMAEYYTHEKNEKKSLEYHQKILTYFQEKAKKGNVSALTQLANYLLAMNEAKQAFAYYQEAAEKNDVEALVGLGHCYAQGIGVERDKKKAFECFQEAVKIGRTSDSLIKLAECYEGGFGAQKDKKKAFEYYQEAAKRNGDSRALNKVAGFYWAGVDVELDREKGFRYYQESAEKGDNRALHWMHVFYQLVQKNEGLTDYYRQLYSFSVGEIKDIETYLERLFKKNSADVVNQWFKHINSPHKIKKIAYEVIVIFIEKNPTSKISELNRVKLRLMEINSAHNYLDSIEPEHLTTREKYLLSRYFYDASLIGNENASIYRKKAIAVLMMASEDEKEGADAFLFLMRIVTNKLLSKAEVQEDKNRKLLMLLKDDKTLPEKQREEISGVLSELLIKDAKKNTMRV